MESSKKMEDLRQNRRWSAYLATQKIKAIEIPSKDKGIKMQGLLLPLGIFRLKMLKIQRANHDPDWVALKRLKLAHRAIVSIIEPQSIQDVEGFKKAGYRLSRFPYLATKTIIVDLQKGVGELWSRLSENTKRLVKKNQDLRIVQVKPAVFLAEWKRWSKIMTLKLSQLENVKRTMGPKARLVIGYLDGVSQSGLLLLKTKDTVNYYHSFTSESGRKNGAHYKLVWEEIRRAKKLGYKFFDFEGVYDERWPQKKWVGFTEFKNKFGGKVVSFPGCFSRWF